MSQTNVYRVTVMRFAPKKGMAFALSRTADVAAMNAQQAIRKLRYKYTREKAPLQPGEFVDEVTRVATLADVGRVRRKR